MFTSPRKYACTAAWVVAAVVLAGCATITPDSPEGSRETTEATPAAPKAPGIPGIEAAFGAISLDYEVFTTVDQLTAGADVAVHGVVGGFTQGSIELSAESAIPLFNPVILRIDRPKVVFGHLEDDSDGNLYVSLSGTASPEEFAAAIPPGTSVAVFGFNLASLEDKDAIAIREGVPPGQALYGLTNPIGLAFQMRGQGTPQLVFPFGGLAPGATVDDLVPGARLPQLVE